MNLREAAGWVLVLLAASLALSIAGVNIAAAVLTVLLLLGDFSGEDVPWDSALVPLAYALVAYFLVAVASAALGAAPAVSFKALNKDFHKLWMLWLLLAGLRFSGRRRCELAFGAALAAVSVVGILQSIFVRQADSPLWTRAHGFVHPVTFGEQLALGLLGALCLLARPAEARERGIRPAMLWAFAAVVGCAFFLNQTRGAFVGLAAGVGALLVADKRTRRWSLWLGLAFAAVLTYWELLPTGRSLLGSAIEHGTGLVSNQQFNRLVFWKVGWRMFLDHPWLGVGPGNYKTLFDHYFQGEIASQRIWGSAHNLYIHQLAERGIVGFAALLAVLGAMTWRAAARVRAHADALNLWGLAACCAFLVMNLTEVAFQNEQVASLMLFVWALGEAR